MAILVQSRLTLMFKFKFLDCRDRYPVWCPIWGRELGCSDEYHPNFWPDTINKVCPKTCGLCGTVGNVNNVNINMGPKDGGIGSQFFNSTILVWELFFWGHIECTGCFYWLSLINLVWGPLKYSKSNLILCMFFSTSSFCLVVLKLILASKLSELQQFENRAANYKLA